MTRTHRDLMAWQKGMGLVRDVYAVTQAFPKEELFGLTGQLRRASVSVPANIAEGAGRGSTKEFLQFLFIARGSLAELDTLLLLAKDLALVSDSQYSDIQVRVEELSGLIGGLIASLRRRARLASKH